MVSKGDLAAVLASLLPAPGSGGLVGADALRCARALGVDGVAVSVTVGSGLNELLWSTPGVSTQLEDLQFTLGEGPGPEVAASGTAVSVPDLMREPVDRWPVLLPEGLALGIRAVFCLPLLAGSACLGTMTLQRARPGPLEEIPLADAWIVTHALTAALVQDAGQWGAFAAAEDGSDFYRAAVHQATGMISVQAGVSLAEALIRLRAHAFRHGRPLNEVAEDVVARRVHFRHDDGDGRAPLAGGGTEGP
ncbi:ANTAR domain-containing protein [Streptomyces sp. BG9H]|uniref:ANTAR domain-containing protein n=1 Tax=Streptomyces anatolicus TaxID=2675858 RepID=A0ABS6YQX8_9ACTN|nr:GAF and ANTAR domain-containing protein [Streptomyces anatolicus]MBW5423805.1 ANTAR domain-containing protein [Streptomyces anatolicus]